MTFALQHEHPWNVAPLKAIAIQQQLAQHVRAIPLNKAPATIAGVDVSIRGDRVQTAIVVIAFPDLNVVDYALWQGPVTFPYVPGLLSFREMPAILPALDQLTTPPDLFMTDSHGLAHPRRFGLACHLGVLLDWPTFGVAKSRLVGTHDQPTIDKGSQSPLFHKKEHIGTVLRTRQAINPVYVSIGHRIMLEEAIALTLTCCPRYKIPEPTRLAHLLSKYGRERFVKTLEREKFKR